MGYVIVKYHENALPTELEAAIYCSKDENVSYVFHHDDTLVVFVRTHDVYVAELTLVSVSVVVSK